MKCALTYQAMNPEQRLNQSVTSLLIVANDVVVCMFLLSNIPLFQGSLKFLTLVCMIFSVHHWCAAPLMMSAKEGRRIFTLKTRVGPKGEI
jgi:hypothetical protein